MVSICMTLSFIAVNLLSMAKSDNTVYFTENPDPLKTGPDFSFQVRRTSVTIATLKEVWG